MRRKLLAVALTAASTIPFGSLAAPSLEQRFAAPPMNARPHVRWWWPGAAVSDAELAREISLLAENGFKGAEIMSATPNFVPLTAQEQGVVNDYAEPSFFAHVRKAGQRAREKGLELDYTFGSSWPSGGGFAVTPERALVELTMSRTEVKEGQGGPVKLEMPVRTKRLGALNALDERVKDPAVADWAKRLDARAHVVAVVAMRGSAPDLAPAAATAGFRLSPWSDVVKPGRLDSTSRVVLTDRLRADGTLDWSPPPGTWQLFVFKQYASNMGVLGAAGRGPQLVVDHFNSRAFAAHAARVGDPLGIRPPGMRSTFVDSLELMQDLAWTDDFLDQFRRRRGYDLTPYLAFVLQPGWMQAWGERWSPPYFEGQGDLGERVRADYRRTVSDLLFDGFLLPFVAWNHAHGIKAKFQAHGGALDTIRGYGTVDIPETEDLPGEGDPIFMRFARSGADLYGRSIVSAESLVWGGRPYDVTPDEMRSRVDLILSGGVNSLVLHGMDYRFHADQWPGWHAFQPSPFALGFSTMFAETNPIWPAVKPLATYIARLQTILQSGTPVVPVAYFYGEIGYYPGIEDKGAGGHTPEKAFLAAGYDFDRINPDAISRARVVQRRLRSEGGHDYSALVLPPVDGIRAETAEAIARFARAGLPVFFTDRPPDRDEGLADAPARDARVRAAVRAALRAGACVVAANRVPSALREASLGANLTFESGDPSGLVFVQRRIGDRLATFLFNHGAMPREVSLALPGAGGITAWDALRGTITPLSARSVGGRTKVGLRLAPGHSALLMLDPRSRLGSDVPSQPIRSDLVPATGWRLRVEGHAGRATYAHDFGPVSLGDWRMLPELSNFAGRGVYRRSIDIDPAWIKKGVRVTLDLGEVHDLAVVRLNGHALATAIAAPFRVELGSGLRAGSNELEVMIANTPQNAMIDPKAAGYKALKPVPAGLVGPVRIEAAR